MQIKIVTGYVPIPGHPRSAAEYGELGEKMYRNVQAPVKAFYTQLDRCWLYREMYNRNWNIDHYEGDNPEKNTLEYHIVQHQKAEWLLAALLQDQTPDTFIWMDYGIAHQPGVTPEVVNEFLPKVAKDDFAIPGAWDRPEVVEMQYPCWRFLGSLWIVPKQYVAPLSMAFKKTAKKIMNDTRRISWEVNTLARIEKLNKLPIRWYAGDHNETQFTHYTPFASDTDRSGEPVEA